MWRKKGKGGRGRQGQFVFLAVLSFFSAERKWGAATEKEERKKNCVMLCSVAVVEKTIATRFSFCSNHFFFAGSDRFRHSKKRKGF